MKRFKGIIIALSIVAALSGCGKDTGKTGGNDAGQSSGKTTGQTNGHEDVTEVDNEYIIINGTVYRVENTDFFTAIDNAVN